MLCYLLLCYTVTLLATLSYSLSHLPLPLSTSFTALVIVCVLLSHYLYFSLARARARTPAERAGQGKGEREHARLLAPAAKTQKNVIAHTVCGCGVLERSADSFFMCTRPTATPSSMSSTLDDSLNIRI